MLMMASSCNKEELGNNSLGTEGDTLVLTIGGDGGENVTKSSSSSTESYSYVVADLSESSGIEGLKLMESVTSMDIQEDGVTETKGTPIYTENLFDFYFKSGLKASAVYTGTTARSDIAATFEKDSEKANTFKHHYHGVDWPSDHKVLFYFQAPETLPDYISTPVTYNPEKKSVTFKTIAGSYPTTATAQKDILFTNKEITVKPRDTAHDDILFYHVFTGVKFRIGNTDAVTKITKVTMTNMLTSGTCTVTPNYTGASVTTSNPLTGTNAATKSASCSVWSHPEETVSRATFSQTYDAVVSYDKNDKNFDKTFYDGSSAKDNLAKSGDTKATTTFMCIPQKFSKSDANHINLTISYTVNGKSKTSTIDFTAALDGKEWKAGQLYTYTLQVNEFGVSVTDDVNGAVKNNVKVTNTGNTTEYVRVAIVGNWMKKDSTKGTVIVAGWNKNEGKFVGFPGTNWWYNEDDGFYYYRKAVTGGQSTKQPLFTSYTAAASGISGAYLYLSVIAQAVPYDSDRANVIAAWGTTVANNITTEIEQ